MNVFQQLFLQTILFGAILGSFAGFFVSAIVRLAIKGIKALIRRTREEKHGKY